LRFGLQIAGAEHMNYSHSIDVYDDGNDDDETSHETLITYLSKWWNLMHASYLCVMLQRRRVTSSANIATK